MGETNMILLHTKHKNRNTLNTFVLRMKRCIQMRVPFQECNNQNIANKLGTFGEVDNCLCGKLKNTRRKVLSQKTKKKVMEGVGCGINKEGDVI